MLKWKYLAVLGLAVAALLPSFSLNGVLPAIGEAHANQKPQANMPAEAASADSLSKTRKRTRMSRRDARAVKEMYAKRYGERPAQ